MARKVKAVENSAVKRAFGYVRVSTTRQADEGVSLDAQKAQIETVCRANGWTLAGLFVEEGVSGSVPFAKRPQGAALWATLRAGDVIVATKLDRAFRDTDDASLMLKRCEREGFELVLADMGFQPVGQNAVGKLVFGMMSNVAAFERARIAERISEAKQHQKAAGMYLGGIVPFGHRLVELDGERFIERDEVVVAAVLELRSRGLASRAIANFLRLEHGIETTHKSVCKLLALVA